ncbi:polycomb protein Sfmbt isoform X2 [Planococcus citri]|uniref:polycomb protein Sfmbt isoform X2 n=1 Tax=Planococcus citri TaxID=170843 RepID=UPI0031F9A1FA
MDYFKTSRLRLREFQKITKFSPAGTFLITDFGMVWMGDMLLQNESGDLMMEQATDAGFFVDASSQSLAEEGCRTQMGMEGFMMLEDLDDSRWYVNGMPEEMMLDGDASNPSSKVVNTSTQTGISNAPPGSRKIKPVKHPGLKLQTPIAYQRDTDLNVIPIQKDGRAVCKKCGAIGVKHAFYTRERRYCSLACARGSDDNDAGTQNDTGSQEMLQSPTNSQWSPDELPTTPVSVPVALPPTNTQSPQQTAPFTAINSATTSYVVPQQPTPQASQLPHQNISELQLPPVFILPPDEPPFPSEKRSSNLAYSYDWTAQLTDPYFKAAPTSCFKHAPMADYWDIDVGLKVEVENTDSYDYSEEFPNSFWIASVLRVEGYKALLRYEGFISDGSKDFWVNLCSSSVHPIGWSALRGKPLIPPKSIKDKYSNWKEFLKRRLTGARTLPSNFYSKVHESMKSRFRCDLTVEVVDKDRISQVKVATIDKIVGKRLQLRYYDSKPSVADVFWCHEDSPLIHPVGWAKRIGQRLDCSPEYRDRIMKGLREKDDSTADLFAIPERFPLPANCFFRKGMKLEAIDPLNLADICVATIMEVLNEGYLMICVDFWNDQHPSTEDWFCYHMTSPCIFPAGFCASNDIPLTPPKDYNKSDFDWNRYLQETGCIAAPAQLFNQDIPDHGLEVGMKLESADLMNPRLVCVATIVRVVGRLLRVHFDGWEKEFDQWVDCNSCDIYPVGWCELVSHKLEPPFSEAKPLPCGNRTGGSRKRRGKATGNTPTKTPQLTEELKISEFRTMRAEEFENLPDHGSESFNVPPPDTSAIDKKRPYQQEWISNAQTSSQQNVSPSTAKNTKSTILVEQNNCTPGKSKLIPRLSDCKSKAISIRPDTWDVEDVAEFLKTNDCATYCDAFIKKGINGRKLLELSKDEVHSLAGMKVGPSLKIQNLINQLIMKVNPAHMRRNKSSLKTVL